MTPRPAYHHGDLRRTLLDVSLALIEEQGLAGLSLREVARRAGVTHQAPYHHFADRPALLAALADEGFLLLLASMQEEQAKAHRAPASQLAAAGRGYVHFALAHPAHFRLMFRPELCPDAPPSVAGGASYQLLVDAVTALQRSGGVPKKDAATLIALCWSAVHGLASLFLDGGLAQADPRRAAREMMALLVRLIAAGA